jgi:adhesin transport system outer membrane protein
MEYAALNNYYDLMFNLSMLTDTILSNPNQDCANIQPRVIDYSPKKQDKETESQLNGLISTSDSKLIRKELGLDTTPIVNSMDREITKKASSDAMKMATSEYKSFLEAPKNFFTINIATKNGMIEASNFIKENNLGDNAYAFEFGPSMKSAKVLYGVYSSVKEAKEALKSLSPSILSGKPYVDNISKHQALYAKYN